MGKYTSKSHGWELLNSWWVLCSLLLFFNWIGLVFIAAKTKKKKFIIIAASFLAAFIMAFVCMETGLPNIGVGVFIISYGVGIVASLIIRGEYLQWLTQEKITQSWTQFTIVDKPVVKASAALVSTLDEYDAFEQRMHNLLSKLDTPIIKEKAHAAFLMIQNLHKQSPNNSLLYGYINNFEGILNKFNELEDTQGVSDELKQTATEKVSSILDNSIESLKKEINTIYTNKMSEFNTDLQTFETDIAIRSNKI